MPPGWGGASIHPEGELLIHISGYRVWGTPDCDHIWTYNTVVELVCVTSAKQHTTNSLPDIGRKFSNRDHTTVIHAIKKIEELIVKDNEIKKNIAEIKKRFF